MINHENKTTGDVRKKITTHTKGQKIGHMVWQKLTSARLNQDIKDSTIYKLGYMCNTPSRESVQYMIL